MEAVTPGEVDSGSSNSLSGEAVPNTQPGKACLGVRAGGRPQRQGCDPGRDRTALGRCLVAESRGANSQALTTPDTGPAAALAPGAGAGVVPAPGRSGRSRRRGGRKTPGGQPHLARDARAQHGPVLPVGSSSSNAGDPARGCWRPPAPVPVLSLAHLFRTRCPARSAHASSRL